MDLDETEWKEFEKGIVDLAISKERKPDDFKQFQVMSFSNVISLFATSY